MTDYRPLLGITMGDPTGIGPEIIVKALDPTVIRRAARPLVVGDAAAMEVAARIVELPQEVRAITEVSEARFKEGTIDVLDLDNVDLDRLKRGTVDASGGEAAYQYIATATDLALRGDIDAIVTAPIHKEALNAAGYHYAGHTEILSTLCGGVEVTMMLVSEGLRVSHVSTHVSLAEAVRLVKKERILKVIELTEEAVRRMGIDHPHIAVAALNPHASDGGLFGTEEVEEIAPAVEEAQDVGMHVTGPVPADTVFYRALSGKEIGRSQFDAVVTMYHDQGHIPVKLLGLLEGVNVTLGLPIIRTSVDHGTAFGKAGKGTGNPVSLVNALELAVEMAKNKGLETSHR